VSLDLKRTGSTPLRGFLGTHIFQPDWGSRFNNKQEVYCGVLLLLTRSFEGYSSSWDF
jgi:hypothetical protein